MNNNISMDSLGNIDLTQLTDVQLTNAYMQLSLRTRINEYTLNLISDEIITRGNAFNNSSSASALIPRFDLQQSLC